MDHSSLDDTSRAESADSTHSSDPVEASLHDEKASELSTEFVGRWSQLVSSTNWEKGRIIHEWRNVLQGSESGEVAYSDEAWSRRVGGVTPQHVGRLRRVYDRFCDSFESYEGLYWSHFLAALDWDDSEMWLEGAVQSGWSVSQMRRMRWEANGASEEEKPAASDVQSPAEDEDFTPLAELDDQAGVQDGTRSVAEGPRPEDPDFGEEESVQPADGAALMDDDELPWEGDGQEQESPFVNLPSLPADLAEALEQFKLAIIRHRADSWSEVRQDDVVRALDALRVFANQ